MAEYKEHKNSKLRRFRVMARNDSLFFNVILAEARILEIPELGPE
jgi:hypothetical protein